MGTPFVTTTLLGSGYAAVCYWLNTEDFPGEAFWEPLETGIGRYTTEEEANREALEWAWSADLAHVVAIDTDAHCRKVTNMWREKLLSSG